MVEHVSAVSVSVTGMECVKDASSTIERGVEYNVDRWLANKDRHSFCPLSSTDSPHRRCWHVM